MVIILDGKNTRNIARANTGTCIYLRVVFEPRGNKTHLPRKVQLKILQPSLLVVLLAVQSLVVRLAPFLGHLRERQNIKGVAETRRGEISGTKGAPRAFPMRSHNATTENPYVETAVSQRTVTSTRCKPRNLEPRMHWVCGFPSTGLRGEHQ